MSLLEDQNRRLYEAARERDRLLARVKVLEGHRDQWRKLAFALYDVARKHDKVKADAVFENYNENPHPLTELIRLVRDELVPMVEMDDEANDPTKDLFVTMTLVKHALEALEA